MRTIIAGSRKIGLIDTNLWWPIAKQLALIDRAVEASGFPITEVVSGLAPGIDTFGKRWGEARGVPVIEMPANWRPFPDDPDLVDRSAGYKRNEEMARIAQACIVVWDGKSRGSKNMIDLAKRYKLRLHIYRFDARKDDTDVAAICNAFRMD